MKINYNDWFYDQHKYLSGNRNGIETYNDTKWIDMNTRYTTLLNISSQLFSEQPYGPVGNERGFDKLIDLLSRSNYTFEDINESLISTYKMSLRNAMSKMVVNTHSTTFHCKSTDKRYLSMYQYSHYYIIDVPFNQLHFGDRDEFIRQRLHQMHNTENDYYIPLNDFVSSEISDILGFTLVCCVNGYICNDCMIAIDDKGFKFKIGWLYSSDADFIIYKLDESYVHKVSSVNVDYVTMVNPLIPYSVLGITKDEKLINKRCLLDIYDNNFVKTVQAPPNFGRFTDEGLELINVQQKTLSNINQCKSNTVSIIIYALKYLNEIPNVYPACNYYDIIDTRRVFTERYEPVKDIDDNTIYASGSNSVNELEICTPPIVIDRENNMSHNTILSCLDMYDDLITFENIFKQVGNTINKSGLTFSEFRLKVINPLRSIYPKLQIIYQNYLKGFMLTSLIPSKSVERFAKLIDNVHDMYTCMILTNVQKFAIDEYYGENYRFFVTSITNPFRNNVLSNFTNLRDISKNYYEECVNNHTYFNRPISGECFISLKYDRENECWLFATPNVKHFKGVQNAFYIDDDLKGDEVFKFFVLYTDTESPSETNVDTFDIDKVLNFDEFYNEAEKHIGYIRYWDIENKLMKLSKMLYNKYDDETSVQVLSKILKHKIDCDDLLNEYPSEINYEASNITSEIIDDNRAPLSINFLFYTLSMINDNKDKMQAYLYRKLVNDKYSNRYADIDVTSLFDNELKYPINYSKYFTSPLTIDMTTSYLPLTTRSCVFYGLPLVTDHLGVNKLSTPYRFVFNEYNNSDEYVMLVDNDIDKSHYAKFNNPSQNGYVIHSYHDDIHICKLLTKYIGSLYNMISELQTNYDITYNQTLNLSDYIKELNKHIELINDYVTDPNHTFEIEDTITITESIINNNHYKMLFNNIIEKLTRINTCVYNNRSMSVYEFFDNIISSLRYVYINFGFDNYSDPRIRMFYIHLKKINSSMNIYEFKHWLQDIDKTIFSVLDDVLARNPNYNLGEDLFTRLYDSFTVYYSTAMTLLNDIDSVIKSLYVSNHISPIISYCQNIINNYIFDLYVLDDIVYDSSLSYNTKPTLLSITLTNDSHTYPPNQTIIDEDATLIFQPVIEKIDDIYYIKNISKICEYTFFNGDNINDCVMNVMNESYQIIQSIPCSLSFLSISSTSNNFNSFDQIININNMKIDIQNIHESYDINADNMIISKKHADMNYEMLIGNQFDQLSHTSQLVLERKTMLQGSIDRIYIRNQYINDMINKELSKQISKRVYFKPVQIMHIDTTADVMTSIGCKYFVGQKVYMCTDDNMYIFPAIITCVDHSKNRGFIEAKIDSFNSKWFNPDSNQLITKYLTTNVECSIVPDNVSNLFDEFSNQDYEYFTNVLLNHNLIINDENIPDMYSVPGDPIFVQNNAEYIYTRLNYIFNDLVPNRFIDDEHKKHHFSYIGTSMINNVDEDYIQIKMINHDMNTLTNQEMYPILRTEPNDHKVWDDERAKFTQEKYNSISIMQGEYIKLSHLQTQYEHATTEREKLLIQIEIDSCHLKINNEKAFQNKMDLFIKELEKPSNWYNVRAYEDALVYISNGRAKLNHSFIPNITDIIYTDKMDVVIYDWEHKCWLSPSTYSVSEITADGVMIDQCDDYTTNNVLHSIKIQPLDGFIASKQLLVYLSYDKSDIYSSIVPNTSTCSVRFKPLLSITDSNDNNNPYTDIRIRKHLDGYENYVFDNFNPPSDFSIKESFYIKRINRSGKYESTPVMRICDINFTNNDNSYDYTYFDMYIRIPFNDVSTTSTFKQPQYMCQINQPIDHFTNGQIIKLICIQNDDNMKKFNGNISSIMFTALTSYTGDDNNTPTLTILTSTLNNYQTGKFICTAVRDNSYPSSGGVITINVVTNEIDLIDSMNSWIKVPQSLYTHHELPDEFILVPNESVRISPLHQSNIKLINRYIKDSDDIIIQSGMAYKNPYEYYFDDIKQIRYPISNVEKSVNDERLIIDQSINTDVKLIKSTYISICRYSSKHIPNDGKINVTGYIPTPLSYNRYEWWVNGRCCKRENVIITSPTTFQLCNLKSLYNFELIELVDDMNDSEVMKKGNVYIDINGKTYGSYNQALLSNQNINQQSLQYTFNATNHNSLQDYTSMMISPNNHNIEDDIMNTLTIDQANPISYNELANVPTINGVSIYHLDSNSMGIQTTPNEMILDMYDKIWSLEATTNPLFMSTHRDGMQLLNNQYLKLHVIYNQDNSIEIYTSGTFSKYFTLYISNIYDGDIDDVVNTKKIIPFIQTGIKITIDEGTQYHGMWLHTTANSEPIKIN